MSGTQSNNRIAKDKNAKRFLVPLKKSLKKSDLAKKLLIKGENLRQFEELRAKILSETVPLTQIENILVEKIISATWRLQRAMEVERNLLNEQNAIRDEERYTSFDEHGRQRIRNIKKVRVHSPEVQHVIQYQIELEKALQKSLSRLREEQALRKKPIPKND